MIAEKVASAPKHPAIAVLDDLPSVPVVLSPELRQQIETHRDLLVKLFQPCQAAVSKLETLDKEEATLQAEIEALEKKPWDDKKAAAESATKREQLTRLHRAQASTLNTAEKTALALIAPLDDSKNHIQRALNSSLEEIRNRIADYLLPFVAHSTQAKYLASNTPTCLAALRQLQRDYGQNPLRDTPQVLGIYEKMLNGVWPFEIVRPEAFTPASEGDEAE